MRFLDDEDSWQPTSSRISNELTRNARFILCASNDPDSLYAWRTYGQGGISCAIGLDPNAALCVVDPAANPSQRRVHHWRQVVYSPAKIRHEARRVLLQLADQWRQERGLAPTEEDINAAVGVIIMNLAEVRSRVRAMAKDSAFANEHEQRVTVDRVSFESIMTTPSSMGPRPHVRLVASQRGRWGEPYERAALAPKLPIRAIRLGPDAPQSTDPATKWLLLANGYEIDPDYADDDDPGPRTPLTWERAVVLDRSKHPVSPEVAAMLSNGSTAQGPIGSARRLKRCEMLGRMGRGSPFRKYEGSSKPFCNDRDVVEFRHSLTWGGTCRTTAFGI